VKPKTVVPVLPLILLFALTSQGQVVLERAWSSTGATRVLITAQGPDRVLVDSVTGEPITPPSMEGVVASGGGDIGWQVKAERMDQLGFRHVFYQQVYRNPNVPLAEAVPIAGGELGFHYDADGQLYAVAGALFDDVASAETLSYRTVDDARTAIHEALQQHPGVTPADLDSRIDLREEAKLWAASLGDGRSFAYVWEGPFPTQRGSVIAARMHGRTGELLSVWDPNPNSDCDTLCEPCSYDQVSANAKPQNPDLSLREGVLWATTTTIQPGYTHEGHRSDVVRMIRVYMGEGTAAGDQCDEIAGNQYYSMLPLKTVGQTPTFDDYGSRINKALARTVPGKAGGDAMLKTSQALDYFHSQGWFGWNGQNAWANVVVAANPTLDCCCGGSFQRYAVSCAPQGSVSITSHLLPKYSQAAALDVVAHEWGHGVIFESVGWTLGPPNERDLHEGWAEVVGHAVEWASEPPLADPNNPQPETAEWQFSEDAFEDGNGTYRDVTTDDGPGGYSYHAIDTPGASEFGHYGGFPLPVALYLSATGGYEGDYTEGPSNPVCHRAPPINPAPYGCEGSAKTIEVTPLDPDRAGAIFFRVLTQYATSASDWPDFVYLAKQAALDLYATSDPCYNADTEQQSVIDAFGAIGYPSSSGIICNCCCLFPCD